jgi:hypothetical protein
LVRGGTPESREGVWGPGDLDGRSLEVLSRIAPPWRGGSRGPGRVARPRRGSPFLWRAPGGFVSRHPLPWWRPRSWGRPSGASLAFRGRPRSARGVPWPLSDCTEPGTSGWENEGPPGGPRCAGERLPGGVPHCTELAPYSTPKGGPLGRPSLHSSRRWRVWALGMIAPLGGAFSPWLAPRAPSGAPFCSRGAPLGLPWPSAAVLAPPAGSRGPFRIVRNLGPQGRRTKDPPGDLDAPDSAFQEGSLIAQNWPRTAHPRGDPWEGLRSIVLGVGGSGR